MDKVETHIDKSGGMYVEFVCPGCKSTHSLPYGNGRWTFNGSLDKPTIIPSILAKGTVTITDEQHAIIMAGGKVEPRVLICHSFVTDGKIQFLDDCTHSLKGTTVELEDINE